MLPVLLHSVYTVRKNLLTRIPHLNIDDVSLLEKSHAVKCNGGLISVSDTFECICIRDDDLW